MNATRRNYFNGEAARALIGRSVRTLVEFSGVPTGTTGKVIRADPTADRALPDPRGPLDPRSCEAALGVRPRRPEVALGRALAEIRSHRVDPAALQWGCLTIKVSAEASGAPAGAITPGAAGRPTNHAPPTPAPATPRAGEQRESAHQGGARTLARRRPTPGRSARGSAARPASSRTTSPTMTQTGRPRPRTRSQRPAPRPRRPERRPVGASGRP